MNSRRTLLAMLLALSISASGQTRPAAAPVPSAVDQLITLKKKGFSDERILRAAQQDGKPLKLSMQDLDRLSSAGFSPAFLDQLEGAPSAPTPQVKQTPARQEITTERLNQRNRGKLPMYVKEFRYSSVHTAVSSYMGGDVNIGQGIRAMLTERIAKSLYLAPLERADIRELIDEVDRGGTEYFDPQHAVAKGKIKGAQAVLLGDIVTFGSDKPKKGFNVKVPMCTWCPSSGVRIGGGEEKAVVAINFRLVDAKTGEVLLTERAVGESSRKGKMFGIDLRDTYWRGMGVEQVMTNSDFLETIIGEATQDAVNKIATRLEEAVRGALAQEASGN
jgi:curli biogenesis system outer membrane secretion channel CsgG